jgi:biotin carboxylase
VQSKPKVLVVGTTSDYIDWIERTCPDAALFLTTPAVRQKAIEPGPAPAQELCCNLNDYGHLLQALEQHLAQFHQHPAGIACFDCESMELAAVLAKHFLLAYPSIQAVRNCRNKFRAKALWQKHLLNTPPAIEVHSAEEAVRFFRSLGTPLVLKPVSGCGSELVFECADSDACERNYHQIREGLHLRRANRLYATEAPGAPPIMAEGMAQGQEYSCDVVVQNGQAQLIRLTRKIRAPYGPFGTIQAYLLTAELPTGVAPETLYRTLYQSAHALGIERAICMIDFMVSNGRISLLELAPRPGGDCLPFLLRRAFGLDMLKLLLDFSCQKVLQLPQGSNGGALVGMRLHARCNGILQNIDTRALEQDPRLQEIHLIRKPGDPIALPPTDYDAWLLGHVIFAPQETTAIETQCNTLLDKIKVTIASTDPNPAPGSFGPS